MKLKYELICRTVAGDTFLVPVGEAARKFPGMFTLNGLGAFLYQNLESAESEEDLLRLVLDNYDVTEEQARKDISEFLDQLREMDLL